MVKKTEPKATVVNLPALRKSKGITQEQPSKELSVSRVTLARWESGRFQPSLDYIIKLAEYFGVSIDDLVGYKGGSKE